MILFEKTTPCPKPVKLIPRAKTADDINIYEWNGSALSLPNVNYTTIQLIEKVLDRTNLHLFANINRCSKPKFKYPDRTHYSYN